MTTPILRYALLMITLAVLMMGCGDSLEQDVPSFKRLEITVENISTDATFTGTKGEPVVMALAPGVFTVSKQAPTALFEPGMFAGPEVEAMAEAGDPTALLEKVRADASIERAALTGDINNASYEEGPIMPGAKSVITVSYEPGDKLGLVMMLGPSNDTFIGTPEGGLALDELKGGPVKGLLWWDAGTEIDEVPGEGMYQLSSTSGTQAGPAQGDVIQRAKLEDEQGTPMLPGLDQVIKVTVRAL